MTPGAPLAEVTRRDTSRGRELVESIHTGHLVVAGADGSLLAGLGDPGTVVFARSTVKPLQATACLELLDAAERDLPAAELAVAWASHRGEPAQIGAVEQLLARSGTTPDRLTCPPAVPEADPQAVPAPVLHNCSGKHALFALAGTRMGVPRDRWLDPAAPLQRAVLGVLEQELGPLEAIGVDGCGAPAVAVPLVRLARAYAALAVEPRFARVRAAGLARPGLVGGRGRLESALLAAGVMAKVGAEGIHAAGWVAEDGTPRGLAVKAADGSARGSAAAVAQLLVDLAVVPPETWSPPPPLGGGRPVGTVRASAGVRELAASGDRLG